MGDFPYLKWYQAIPLYTHSLPLNFLTNEKGLKNVKTKIFIFEYSQKIPSEINSTQTFHPILIPKTSYVISQKPKKNKWDLQII